MFCFINMLFWVFSVQELCASGQLIKLTGFLWFWGSLLCWNSFTQDTQNNFWLWLASSFVQQWSSAQGIHVLLFSQVSPVWRGVQQWKSFFSIFVLAEYNWHLQPFSTWRDLIQRWRGSFYMGRLGQEKGEWF